MSSLTLPDTPAWEGLIPEADAWRPVDGPVAVSLCSAVGCNGMVLARPMDRGMRGFYRLVPVDGGRELFLKVVSPERSSQLVAADRVAAWLDNGGVAVASLIDGPRRLPDGDQVLVQPWIDGRFIFPREKDLRALGLGLARLHRVLRRLPWSNEVRQSSRVRDRWLDQQHRHFCGQRLSCPRHAEVTDCLRAGRTFLPNDNAQVLHGDMNLGNVLIEPGGEMPVFLDFEDSLHNWHSPLVDLAMSLERFVLVHCADDDEAASLGRVFLEAYREGKGPTRFDSRQADVILKALAVRALVLLLERQRRGQPVADSEWEKFLVLADQARRRGAVLAAMAEA